MNYLPSYTYLPHQNGDNKLYQHADMSIRLGPVGLLTNFSCGTVQRSFLTPITLSQFTHGLHSLHIVYTQFTQFTLLRIPAAVSAYIKLGKVSNSDNVGSMIISFG